MKQCTNCGRENDDTAVKCSGCGQPLDQTSSKDPAQAPIVVASFHSLEEAELLKSELEAAGIEAYVPEEYTTGVFSSVIPFQKVTVQVLAADADAARAIAATFAAASRDETEAAAQAAAQDSGESSKSASDAADPGQQGMTRCVSCGEHIPLDSVLCPKCGWTQPRLA